MSKNDMQLAKFSCKSQILILGFSLAPLFPAIAQRAPRVVYKTSDQLLARIIKWQEPKFPAIARQAGAGGPVVVDLIIDENGNVVSAQITSGHPLLQAVLLQAARAWKFKPTRVNGVSVRLRGRITYEFPSSEDLFEGKTLGELEKQTREKPDSAEAHYDLGVAYFEVRRYEEAVSQLTEAIRIFPNNANAHLKLGHAYSRLHSHPEAVAAFTEAARLNPDSSEALHALGLANMALGDYEAAIEAFQRSLQVEGPITTSHFMLGKCYVLLGRAGEAIGHYQRGLSKYADSDLGHFGLGEAYFTLERYADAINELKQAIKFSKGQGRSRSHYLLGLAYLRSGNREAALEEYDILKKLDVELAKLLINEIRESSKRSGVT